MKAAARSHHSSSSKYGRTTSSCALIASASQQLSAISAWRFSHIGALGSFSGLMICGRKCSRIISGVMFDFVLPIPHPVVQLIASRPATRSRPSSLASAFLISGIASSPRKPSPCAAQSRTVGE